MRRFYISCARKIFVGINIGVLFMSTRATITKGLRETLAGSKKENA